MATVIGVHGTYAHSWNSPEDTPVDPQWWEPGSQFGAELREHLEAPTGPIDVTHFKWSGDNSELGRRKAGRDLYHVMKRLEAKGEPYSLIGHSHGGSVVSAALLLAAARNDPLPNLKRWITVGTPFVKLRRERLLFTRLHLLGKVLFVASMMLFLMFMFYLVAGLASGEGVLLGRAFPGVLVATGAMMSLPALLFYVWSYVWDRRKLLNYRRYAMQRARDFFGPRWLSLAHTDDEAIQGLAFLPGAKLFFFDKHFAVHAITIASVVALPFLYLLALLSPSIMVGIADLLKNQVYEARSSPEAEAALKDLRRLLRDTRDRVAGRSAETKDDPPDTPAERREAWSDYRTKRQELETRFPNLAGADRALRFKQRFFESHGNPCDGGKLCGNGYDLRVNSALLLHVATDELSWALGAADPSDWQRRWLTSVLVPAILLPVIFALISLTLMLLIRGIAMLISRAASYLLNQMTNAEVKRAAFGNDTEGEIAVGAVDRPMWLERSQPRLPSALADLVTAYSNGMATRSFAKFRRAIGQLALAEPKHTAESAITTYFTWKELVHSAYFDVPEFRKLIYQALSRAEGVAPSSRFKSDSEYGRTAQWLAEIETAPGTAAEPAEQPPDKKDAAAVSEVVAATVKVEP